MSCALADNLQAKTVFTSGEDGLIRAWKPSGEEIQSMEGTEEEEGVSLKPKRQKKKDRFKPY